MAVSLRVPDSVKKRLAKLARVRQTTPHALMVEAIREKLDAEELRTQFVAEAQRRLEKMKKSRKGIPAGEVFEYLEGRIRGESPARPRLRRLA